MDSHVLYVFTLDRLWVSVDVASIAFVFYESEALLIHGSVLFARG